MLEAAKAWATVEQADKLRPVKSRPKSAVARVDSAKEKTGAVVGRGGQGSSAHSGVSKPRGSCWNCGKEGHRMPDCPTKREVGESSNRPLLGLVVCPLGKQSPFQQSFKQGSGQASFASGKSTHYTIMHILVRAIVGEICCFGGSMSRQ